MKACLRIIQCKMQDPSAVAFVTALPLAKTVAKADAGYRIRKHEEPKTKNRKPEIDTILYRVDTTYYIELSLKTVNGIECVGKFFVGNDRQKAQEVFRKLQGSNDVNENNVMFMSFMETKNGLPLNVDMISCTLDELGENSKIITKELFKLHALT